MASGAVAGQAGRGLIGAALGVALLGVASVRAEDGHDGPRVELELGSGVARDGLGGRASLWSPLVTVSMRAGPRGASWLRAGGTMAVDSAGAVGFAASNLSLGWAQQLGDGLVLKLAGALPVARRGRGADALAETGARAIRGHWEAWQWLGDHAAIAGALLWAWPTGPLLLEAQACVAFMIPTQAREGSDGLARGDGLALEARARASFDLGAGLWLGLAAQLAWTPTVTRDAGAWALAPELRWVGDRGVLGVGALVNLDAPWGPSWVRDVELPRGALAAGRGAVGVRISGAWRF